MDLRNPRWHGEIYSLDDRMRIVTEYPLDLTKGRFIGSHER